jgi:hypothetical protein
MITKERGQALYVRFVPSDGPCDLWLLVRPRSNFMVLQAVDVDPGTNCVRPISIGRRWLL